MDSMSFPTRLLSKSILSIQSSIVHGYVGNNAATFPLQVLGFNTELINTVSLSNHPAYPKLCKGHSLQPNEYNSLIQGLLDNDLLKYDAVLSGYCKSPDILMSIKDTISTAKSSNPNLLYFLDPVLGDNGNYYVPKELMDVYRTHLLPIASVITPNQFEAEELSGIKLTSMHEVERASHCFHSQGVQIYVQKGLKLQGNEGNNDSSELNVIASIALERNKDEKASHFMFRKQFPALRRNFSGCGDLFSALITALVTRYHSEIMRKPNMLGDVLDLAVAAMTGVLKTTASLDSKELSIIESFPTFNALRQVMMKSSTTLSVNSDDNLLQPAGDKAYVIKGPIVGVIFDMDGTLTEPGAIDFKKMYERLGFSRGGDVLQLVEAIADPAEKARAYEIIEEEEDFGCERMEIRDGVIEVLEALDDRKIRVAISTRNIKKSVHKFVNLLPINVQDVFSHLITRDCVDGINKPDPRVAWHIMNEWGYLSRYQSNLDEDGLYISDIKGFGDIWFVGDSIDDMKCGKNAGCKTCLLTTSYNLNIPESLVDLRVNSIHDFKAAVLID